VLTKVESAVKVEPVERVRVEGDQAASGGV